MSRDRNGAYTSQRLSDIRQSIIDESRNQTLDQLLILLLEKVGMFVNSPIGFYYLSAQDENTPSFQLWATRTSDGLYQAEDKLIHNSTGQPDVWLDCMAIDKPVIHNDSASILCKKGLRDGHSDIIRELVVPALRGGKVTAILGTGNKPTNYTNNDADMVSYIVDVTLELVHKKRLEGVLRKNERLLNTTGKVGKIGGWEYDLVTGQATWTRKLYDIIELPYDQRPPGVDELWGYFPPRERNIIELAYNQAVQYDKPFDLELQVNTFKRNLIWCRVLGEPMFHNDKCVTMHGIFQDITKRKQVEENTRHLTSILRAIRKVNQLIVREKNLHRLIHEICEILVSTRGYYNAWIALFDEKESLLETAEFGLGEDSLAMTERLKQIGLKVCGSKVLEQSDPVVIEDPVFTCLDCPLSEKYRGRSGICIRLNRGGRYHGILTVSVTRHHAVNREELSLLKEVADDISIAIKGIEAETRRKEMQIDLIESEVRYRTLIEMSPAAILVLQEGKSVYCNPEAVKIFGASRAEELIGISVSDLVHPDYHAVVEKRRAQANKERRPLPSMEQKYIGFDGRIIDIEATGTYIAYDGKPSILSVFKDITERKRSEEALRESEERYRQLFDNNPNAVRVFDAETLQIEDANQASVDLHGYSREEFLSLKITDISAEAAETKKNIKKFLKDGSYAIPIRYFKRKDGSIFAGELYSGIFVSGGRRKIIGSVRDLTERMKADQTRIRLETAIEQSADTIMITDESGTIQYVNPSFEQITGYSREDVIGQNPRILKSGKQSEGFYTAMWRQLLRGQRWTGRFVNRRCDGSLYEEEASISPIRNRSGAITNYVAVKQDITDKIKMEEQLRQAQKMETIGTLAGGIAHDFNNILSAVIGYGELAIDGIVENSDLKDNLQEIIKAGYRARDLVKQILTFSRQVEQEIKPVSMKHIAKEALKLLRASIPSTIEIHHEIRSDKMIMGDPTQIHQLIMNLCTNAAQAMRENGGVLDLSLLDEEVISESKIKRLDLSAGHYIRLSVRDTGIGIPRGIADRIFDPFFTTKGNDEGTGLGLSVVHGIVKSMGGVISVHSEINKGTAFDIYLPPIHTETEPQEITHIIPLAGNEHILIVDDEIAVVDILKRILEKQGYRVTIRTSSIEALELFKVRSREFDLIVSDLTMPNMTGLMLSKEIKTIRPDIPIILCSGFADQVSEAILKGHDIATIIRKPIGRIEILQKVRHIFDQELYN